MIGKPGWFKRRKYAGWGVFPKTWQGWLYIALVIIPFAVFQALPFWSTTTRIIVTAFWVLFLLIDVTQIMIKLNKDEREKKHEAIAERNALWAMMLFLVLGVFYQIMQSSLQGKIIFDPIILIALFVGVIVKAISNIYLDRKD